MRSCLIGVCILVAGIMCLADDQNTIAGKIFDVNPIGNEARFLKQDVAIDPETGLGKAWYTVQWADTTPIIRKTRQANYAGIEGPIVAEFRGLNKHNLEAVKAGKAFTASQVFLFPKREDVTGISEDGTTVTGWFTPDKSGGATGSLKVNDQSIAAKLQRGGSRIVIFQKLTDADLTKGFWKATVTVKEEGDTIIAEKIMVEPLVNPLEVDDPKLPRVLSVGDSISINYMNSARENLKGIANYHRIEDNCWSTRRGMAFISYWLGDYTRDGLGWDVILFNSGMHDMKQKTLGGPYAVSLEEYKSNLRNEIKTMQKTNATLIFVTTTPVPNDGGSERYAYRSKGAEKDFNNAALELLKEFPEIRVLDLAKAVNESPVMDKWRQGKDVHYWNEDEQAVLGETVAAAVKHVLAGKANP